MTEEIRDLTPNEVAAMWLWSSEYAKQGKGAIEFFKNLGESKQKICINMVEQMKEAIQKYV